MSSSGRISRIMLPLLASAGFALPAGAVDGVIEINQASALAGGVTACDTPGFPVSLCASGAYRLTSNLQYPSASVNAIFTAEPDVSIDLNGMTISGANTCTIGPSGWVTSCTQASGPAAVRTGVRAVVSNGRIKGAAGAGVHTLDAAALRNLQVTDCGQEGIATGGRSTVVDVATIGNGEIGIYAASEVRISGAVATNNGGYGITVATGSTVGGVVASQNRFDGILLDSGSQLKEFSAYRNGERAVLAFDGSVVDSGSIRDNGQASPLSCGLEGSGGAGYRGVVITSIVGGNTATACGMVNLGGNSCQGVPCPP